MPWPFFPITYSLFCMTNFSTRKKSFIFCKLQRGIDENMEAALEHNPEAFARVVSNCLLAF